MKRKFAAAALLLISAFVLYAGCGTMPQKTAESMSAEETGSSEPEPAAESSEYESFCAAHTFISDLPDADLKKPDRVIRSRADFVYALDYLAFYRIGEKIFFEIDPVYAEGIAGPYPEFSKACEAADLADVYACQLDDSWYTRFGVAGVQYSMSRDIADEPPETVPDTPVVLPFDIKEDRPGEEPPSSENDEEKADRTDGDPEKTDRVYPADSGRARISCENSEQLYYLVMNGYRPVPVPGSTAEALYEEAQRVLRSRISDEMSDFEKIRAVYDYLTTQVVYDAETAYSAETYLVRKQAYYLEGVFLNHCAVCDGKAKAYALLLNMAGIPCWRTTGVNGEGDHAWNMVRLDGKWYISCTTYGQTDMTESLGRIVSNHSMLLAGTDLPYAWYPAQKHREIEAELSETGYDVFSALEDEDGICRHIADLAALQTLLAEAQGCGREEYTVEFVYTGTDRERFQAEMTGYLETLENANAVEIKSSTLPVYQVIIL